MHQHAQAGHGALRGPVTTASGLCLVLCLLFAGTASAAGRSLYGTGQHLATGSIIDPTGRVWVADHVAPSSNVVRVRWDPATKLFALDGLVPMSGQRARPVATAVGPDTGTMFLVGLPFARIAAGPTNAAGAASPDPAFTNDTTPTFTVSGDETLQCALRLDGRPPVATDYADCTAGAAPGTRTFTAPELTEGTYVLATRAHDGVRAGLPEGRTFTVDTTAPAAPGITGPATDGTVVDGVPAIAFTAEAGAAFRCNLDGPVDGPYVACAPGRPFAFSASGAHTLLVRAVDRAGNSSAPSAPRAFTVDTLAPTVTIGTPAEDATTGGSPVVAFSPRDPAGTPPVLAPAPLVRDAQGEVVRAGMSPALRLRSLFVSATLGRHRVRREGLRFVMRVPAGTEVVRVRVIAVRGRLARRVVWDGLRLVPRAGTLSMRLQAVALRRTLGPGRYLLEVTPGYGRRALGGATSRPFRVVRRPAIVTARTARDPRGNASESTR